MKRALVTGCAGFVGSHVSEKLLDLGYQVIGIDNYRTGKREFMEQFLDNKNFSFEQLNLNTCDNLESYFDNIEIVYHLAANADVRGGVTDTHVDLQFNVLMTHRILECMRKKGIHRLCFASTAAALGEPDVFPTPEDISVPTQTSIYGASKLSCEHFISAYSNCFGIEAYAFRFVSLLGPRYPHGHVIDFVRRLKEDPSKLQILGDGSARKSYLHIEDCISALTLVCEDLRPALKKPIKFDVFNLGSDGFIRVRDSAELIAKVMSLNPQFEFEKQTRGWKGDNPFVHLSIEKIKKLGWAPKYSIQESIQSTVDWLLAEEWMLEK
ncbi:NAD-dependent epimerase/dehydratase family protein [Planktomarina temperata]|nr:NAD-dependent epimerase/dehydratase family protein [Planktomarina temperata]